MLVFFLQSFFTQGDVQTQHLNISLPTSTKIRSMRGQDFFKNVREQNLKEPEEI